MGSDRRRHERFVPLFLGVLLTLSLGTSVGVVAGSEQRQAADYEIDGVDEFDYYNSRGFEDTNGDGRVVVAVRSMIDLSESRDPVVHYGGTKPFVLRGSGGFENSGSTLLKFAETEIADSLDQTSEAPITIDGISIERVRSPVFEVAGPVTLRDVTVRETATVVKTDDNVDITDSEFTGTGRILSTERGATLDGVRIENASTISADGQVTLTDTTIRNVEGDRGGAVNAGSVLVETTTIEEASAARSGGAIDAENGVTISDSRISDVHSGRSGGAVATGGTLRIENSVIADSTSGQDASLFGFGALEITSSRIEHVGPMSSGYSTQGSIAVADSELVDTGKLIAREVGLTNATMRSTRGFAVEGNDVDIRRSVIEDSGGIEGGVVIIGSILKNVDRIDEREYITIRDSVLLSFGKLTSSNEYWELEITNSTIHGSSSPLVPAVNTQSISRVNFIEVQTPVFEGRLPDKELVFVDSNTDREEPGEWTADVFWSREDPFDSVERLPDSAVQTATPAQTDTPAQTTTQTASETESAVTDRESDPVRQNPTDASGPGFGIALTLLSGLLSVLLLTYRYRE